MNKVIARFTDGRIVKGMTADFFPTKEQFHVSLPVATGAAEPMQIRTAELKALFFVKDFEGDPRHDERNEFDAARLPVGRQIKVVFGDGEHLVGITTGYQPGRPGFFLEPADPESNIDRCYVVTGSTEEISFL